MTRAPNLPRFYQVNTRQNNKSWEQLTSFVTYQDAQRLAKMVREEYPTFEVEVVFTDGFKEHP